MLYGVKRATSATYLSPIGLTRLRDSLSFMETAGSQRTLHRLNLVDQFSDPEKRFGVLTPSTVDQRPLVILQPRTHDPPRYFPNAEYFLSHHSSTQRRFRSVKP